MRIGASMRGVVGKLEFAVTGIVLSIILLIISVSGCSSVISNSARFYRDNPSPRIESREYTSD